MNKIKNSGQTLKDFEIFFIKCLQIQDAWLFEKMSLPIILNQINTIRIKLKGGYNGKNDTLSDQDLAELAVEAAIQLGELRDKPGN